MARRCSTAEPLAHKRVMGIEPTYPAWKAGVLPLNYTRIYMKQSTSLRVITHLISSPANAQSRNRTSDTRIFSPLLYQLSYLGNFVSRPSPSILFWIFRRNQITTSIIVLYSLLFVNYNCIFFWYNFIYSHVFQKSIKPNDTALCKPSY